MQRSGALPYSLSLLWHGASLFYLKCIETSKQFKASVWKGKRWHLRLIISCWPPKTLNQKENSWPNWALCSFCVPSEEHKLQWRCTSRVVKRQIVFALPLELRLQCTCTEQKKKKWCPKDLCPAKASMGKAKKDFLPFTDVGQGHKREDDLHESVQKSGGKAMPPMCWYQPCHCQQTASSQLGAFLPNFGGGSTHQSRTMPQGWFQEQQAEFGLFGHARNTLGKTAARRSMVKDVEWWRNGLWMMKKWSFKEGSFWCNGSFCRQEDGAHYHSYGSFPQKW